jgi:hypothetical protein
MHVDLSVAEAEGVISAARGRRDDALSRERPMKPDGLGAIARALSARPFSDAGLFAARPGSRFSGRDRGQVAGFPDP